MMLRYVMLVLLLALSSCSAYDVVVIQRDSDPILSYLVQGNSVYRQVFNPTWVPPSPGTRGRKGLLIRTQDCDFSADKCVFCGGAASKASLLTFS